MSRSSWTGSHNARAIRDSAMNGRRPWKKLKSNKKRRQWNRALCSGRVEA